MRKRLLRYLSALIVSVICTYTGMQRTALAQTEPVADCSLNDVFSWQQRLESPEEEATPAYVQRVSEAFIAACPNRPEVSEAHRIAGLAAGWGKNIEAAATHFELAGHVTDVDSLFMHAAVRLALGDKQQAWHLRDAAIEFWLVRLSRQGIGDIEIDQLDNGQLISINFRMADKDNRQSTLWIAKPGGAGWPAALTVSSDRQLNTLHRLRAGDSARDLHMIRLYRCTSRKLLGRSATPVSDEDVAATAKAALSAYLADPDVPKPGKIESCLFAARMLPEISLGNAVAIQ